MDMIKKLARHGSAASGELEGSGTFFFRLFEIVCGWKCGVFGFVALRGGVVVFVRPYRLQAGSGYRFGAWSTASGRPGAIGRRGR